MSGVELGRTISTFSSNVTTSRISSVAAVQEHSRRLRPVVQSNAVLANRFYQHSATMYMSPPPGDFNGSLVHAGSYQIEISAGILWESDGRVRGEGGERNVYNMRFLKDNSFSPASQRWVVKENRHIEKSDNEEMSFHRTNLVTQSTAQMFADKFNQLAQRLALQNFPTVSTCCEHCCLRP